MQRFAHPDRGGVGVPIVSNIITITFDYEYMGRMM